MLYTHFIILADDGCNTATESSQTNRLLRVFHSCYFHYSEDLYDVCPQYLLLDYKCYDSLYKQQTDNTLKRAYINGDPILKELSEVAPHYLLKEYIITDSGILVEESEVKYLGILFDNCLTFNSHIGSITDKISKVVGILWKARSLPLNNSLIYTHINYAILIWGSEISRNITRGITGLEHIPKSL